MRLCKSSPPAAFIIIFSCVLSSRLLPPAFFRATLSSSFNLERRFLLKNAKNMHVKASLAQKLNINSAQTDVIYNILRCQMARTRVNTTVLVPESG